MAVFSVDCLDLVKEFEGFRANAYPDPGTNAEPWTIGYGHTEDVHPWMTCTSEQATEWLRVDLEWASLSVEDYVRVELWQSAHDALTSLVFNIGATAFSESTLVERLNNGEPVLTVISEELPRWVNAGGREMAGLVRRRESEIELAREGAPRPVVVPVAKPPIELVAAAEHFDGLEHQIEAFDYLQELLTTAELEEFARLYRNSPGHNRTLPVRYYYQLDSETPQGFRMCFSSTNAMVVEFLHPGTLSSYGDDDYLARVEEFGDTTDSAAQVKALESYGIECDFLMSGGWEDLEDQLSKGYPIPVGWLQKGHVGAPNGSGHWSLVVGMDGDDLIVHDPFGEARLVAGGYVSKAPTAGQFVRYSRKNFGSRWMVEGPGTGWMIRVK